MKRGSKNKTTRRRPYAIPIIMILFGIIFSLIGAYCIESLSWTQSFFYQLGAALTIGGLISLALGIPEYIVYFERRLANILSEDTFLRYLSREKLEQIRSIITKKLCDVFWDEEGESLYDLVIERVFPFLSEPYRKNFRDFYDYSRLPDNENVILVKSKTEYDLVPVKEGNGTFKLNWVLGLKKIPNFDDKLLKSINLYVDDELVEITPKESEIEDEVRYEFTHELVLEAKKHIKITCEHYTPVKDELTLRMVHLTKNVVLDLAFEKDYKYEAKVFGLPAEYSIHQRERGITVEYPDWMLPKHGIIVIWREKI